ncbi:MAG: undecaprenyl-phosphate glucose phosphotransferase [Candidatus Omnitrophica bacterium CG1_02_46_14]|nr:MAG: undecaprenyl-phosphate glucose phosphotransferase [Candidatus Omnitrophica bacterium CG1_02_46_14]
MILPRRRKRDNFLPWIQLAVDSATIYGVLAAAFWIRFASHYFVSTLGRPDYHVYLKSFHLVVFVSVFFLRFYGLYRPGKLLTFSAEIGKVTKAVGASVIVLTALTFFVRGFSFSRTFLMIAGLFLAFGISLSRFILGLCVMKIDQIRGSFRTILIVGADENARRLARFYKNNPRFSTRVEGFLDDKAALGTKVEGSPVLGRISEIENYIKFHRQIHEIVLAAQGMSNEAVLKIIYECEKEMVTFRWIADIFGLLTSKMNVAYLAGTPLLSFMDSPLGDWENRVLKRLTDVLISSAALILLSPVFIVIACWIKKDSRGPIFYKQQRIGQDGHRFLLVKFRTMEAGAEQTTGPVWTKADDPRRTKCGSFLRKNNLDELPQLMNVLKGDMSLVGPRPERPFFVSQFKEDIPRYMARHSIQSGITGWAQVNGLRGNTSIKERTKFDLYYIENWSLWLDAKIMFMTMINFFKSPNAY